MFEVDKSRRDDARDTINGLASALHCMIMLLDRSQFSGRGGGDTQEASLIRIRGKLSDVIGHCSDYVKDREEQAKRKERP